MERKKYKYTNLPIPGGGYVTGFQYHRKEKGILYARTDIGGTWRYEQETGRWKSLCEHVGMDDLAETFPIGIALDDSDPDMLYIACGESRGWWGRPEDRHLIQDNGVLAISGDRGERFTYKKIPCYIHGNLAGRGTGDRLLVSHTDSDTLIFASQTDGLLISRDRGDSWVKKSVCGEEYLTLIWLSDDSDVLVVGTAGISNMTVSGTDHTDEAGSEGDTEGDTAGSRVTLRGHSLYVSFDMGETFSKLTQPRDHVVKDSLLSGYVAERICSDERYLYITMSNTGACNYLTEMGYSCDTGDMLGGKVLRYELADIRKRIQDPADDSGSGNDHEYGTGSGIQGEYGIFRDISPENVPGDLDWGFGGISACAARPGLLVVATLCRRKGEILYLSYDCGDTWERALYGLETGNLHFNTHYMRPEYNGGGSLIHWPSDVKMDPFDPDTLFFNTGTGVFKANNLTSPDRSFEDHCDGLEETVHLNLYSPPSGDIRLIDLLGDLGGFAFRDIHTQCDNSFADDKGNRYITCLNADYPDQDPSMIAVTARGNWTGKTIGGLILTTDGAGHFERLPLPYGLSEEMDRLCRGIEHPNVNVGWVAVGADGRTIVLGLADGIDLYADNIAVTDDRGEHWEKVTVRSKSDSGIRMSGIRQFMKVFADRTVPGVFYGFGENGRFFVSRDNGRTFDEKEAPGLPRAQFGLVDCADKTGIRGDSGFAGTFYIAVGEGAVHGENRKNSSGLWKLTYDMDRDLVSTKRITAEGDTVYRIGLGRLAGESGYIGCRKSIYICGRLRKEADPGTRDAGTGSCSGTGKDQTESIYGFFRSDDDGTTWMLLSDDEHRFGEINSIEGDSVYPGVFYIGTGTLGVLAGTEEL